MPHYPVFLDLRGREVLVVGGGAVALRKILALIDAGARITLVSPEIHPDMRLLPATIRRRAFRPSDINKKYFLIFTATSDREVNHRVATLANRARIPVNVADDPEECSFLVPSRLHAGPVQIAISTGGEDPALAKSVREGLEAFFKDKAAGRR